MSTTPPTITFHDDNRAPQLGRGVWQVPAEQTADVVCSGIEAGYRLIDTAAIYGNEAEVGAGLQEGGRDRAQRQVDAPRRAAILLDLIERIGNDKYALGQNSPNPFNPTTTIPFTIGDPPTCTDAGRLHRVTLRVYNMLGQLVSVPILQGDPAPGEPIQNLSLPCGSFTAFWNGNYLDSDRDVASGIYLYRLEVDGKAVVKKMTDLAGCMAPSPLFLVLRPGSARQDPVHPAAEEARHHGRAQEDQDDARDLPHADVHHHAVHAEERRQRSGGDGRRRQPTHARRHAAHRPEQLPAHPLGDRHRPAGNGRPDVRGHGRRHRHRPAPHRAGPVVTTP